ncbi:MAG: TIGR03016 family PEP-CTERM system-associated outer membrane protein [Gammaproteobacteria bacterium]|nr:TIGR03016 family PEP-CTERM system-associated outer membrane protein [Gammaproteobacteria bacterium]
MNRRIPVVARVGCAILPLLIASGPSAAVEIGGKIIVGAIYSDNITLAQDGAEDGDVVYRAVPTIDITASGRRYDFNLDYSLEALWFQDQPDSTEAFSQGNTTLDIEILEEHLFLKSLASVSQAVIDPEQPFATSNVPQIGNRTDAIRYQTGPEWRQDILGASLVVSYDVGRVQYSDDLLQDGDYQNLDTDLTGPERERGLTWEVHHEYRNYDYEISPNARRQLAELSLVYHLRGGWAPFASAGMESDVEDRSSASLEDGIWRAGLRRETARNSFEAFVGERSFGSSWGARFQQQYGADSGDYLRLAYRETPRTNEELDATLDKPVTGGTGTPPVTPPPPVVPPDVVAPGTGQYYLSKRGDFIIARTFNRSTVSANAFYEDTETLDQDTPADSDSTRQTGLALLWTYQLGARTQAGLDGYYANRQFSRVSGEDDEDDIVRARVALTYMLGSRTSVSGYVGYEDRSGSDVPTNNYSENQVGLFLGRTF